MKKNLKNAVKRFMQVSLALALIAAQLPVHSLGVYAEEIPVEILYEQEEGDTPVDIEIVEEPETVEDSEELTGEPDFAPEADGLEGIDGGEDFELIEDADDADLNADGDHAANDGISEEEDDTVDEADENVEIREVPNHDSMSDNELYNQWTNQDKPEGFTPKETSIDPYGYGYNVPFYLNRKSNIAVYATNNMCDNKTTQRVIKSYALKKYDVDPNTGYVFDGATEKRSYDIPMSEGKVEKELNYVQMVAFDPTGSGRKDHLALIGVYNTMKDENGEPAETKDKKAIKELYLYVYNSSGAAVSGYKYLGNVSWMGETDDDDCDNTWCFNASNFLGITAGDYDGDKKDTLVIWGCYDDGEPGKDDYNGYLYGLKEVTVTSGNPIGVQIGETSKTLLHNRYNESGETLSDTTWVEDKLCCALNTCDVNGDRIDDLQVLSYVDVLSDSHQGRHEISDMYRPVVTVSFGQKKQGSSILKDTPDQVIGVVKQDSKDAQKYISCMAAGLSAGDINGDGFNEIVVVGMKNTIKGKIATDGSDGNEPVIEPYDFDDHKMVIGAYKCSEENVQSLYFDEADANKWTYSGLYPDLGTTNDRVMQQYGVKCVAINGIGNPAMVFINGDLYKYADSKFSVEYAPEYFSDSRMIPGSVDDTNVYIVSAAAGNFDGNKYGREQVVCTIGLKVTGHERYFMAPVLIGGVYDQDSTGLAKGYYCTSHDTLTNDSKMEQVFFPKRRDPQSQNAQGEVTDGYDHGHLTQNHGLNYCICAIDNSEDNDALLVRFHEKGWVYTDPDVLCVLQAVPSYEELEDFEKDESVTFYSTESSVAYEDEKADEVSFGAGVTAGLDTPAGGFDVKAGYSSKWSHSFSEKLSTKTAYEYKTTGSDAVALRRTPVTLYVYQVMNKNGQWGTTKDDYIVMSFPGTPETAMLSVDRYNQFVKYYNKRNNNKATLPQLVDTDKKKLYLNTDRDPSKYINSKSVPADVTVIQTNPNGFNTETGATGFSYEQEHEESSADSMAQGYSFEFATKVKAGFPEIVEASAGVYVSLDEMHESTHTTIWTDGTGIGCDVENAERSKMLKAGFTDAAADRYGYSYQVAQWDSPIVKKVGKTNHETGEKSFVNVTVPILGYVLSNVRKPVYPSITAPKTLTLNYGYGKTSTGKFTVSGDPNPKVQKTSGDSKITYNSGTGKLDVAKGLAAGSYNVKLKASNGIPGKETTKTYTVKVNKRSIKNKKVVLDKTKFTYDGKEHKPKVKTIDGLKLKNGTDYTIKWSASSPKKAGKYTMTIKGKGNYSGEAKATFSILKKNPLSVKGKEVRVEYYKLKKNDLKYNVSKVIKFTKKGKGTLEYSLSSAKRGKKSLNKKFKVNSKTGKITIQKGLDRGVYVVKVKVSAAGNSKYNAATKTATIKFTVKD